MTRQNQTDIEQSVQQINTALDDLWVTIRQNGSLPPDIVAWLEDEREELSAIIEAGGRRAA